MLGRFRCPSFWVPAAIALTGLAITFVALHGEWGQRDRDLSARFEAAAHNRADAIHRELEADLTVVRMLAGLVSTDGKVDPTTFRGLSEAAIASRSAPIRALQWVEAVPYAELPIYEDRVGFEVAERTEADDLVPVQPRSIYYPITHVTPLAGNEPALGYDLGSDTELWETFGTARNTGELQVSGRLRLVQDTDDQFAFLAVQAVYDPRAPLRTPEDRRAALLGFTIGSYHAGDLIGDALSAFAADEAEVLLIDPHAPPGEEALATFPATATWVTETTGMTASEGGNEHVHVVTVGGSEWAVVVRRTAAFGAPVTLGMWLTLGAGIALTLVVAALVRGTLVRARQIASVVVERTSELSAERDRYQGIFENAIVGIYTTGFDHRIRTINSAGLQLLGRSLDEVTGMKPIDLVAPDHRQRIAAWRVARDAGQPVDPRIEVPILRGQTGEFRWISVHMHSIFTADGVFAGGQAVFHDIDDEIERRNRLEERAATDGLTGLPNRREFDLFLDEHAASRRYGPPVSLLMIDLDHFKLLNDDYGHQAGDAALQAVAAALIALVRSQDLVARYGGEEFTVVLPRTGLVDAALFAERCRAAIEAIPCTWEAATLQVTASIGVATFDPRRHASPGELLRDADGAVYAAKRAGRNMVRVANDLAPERRAA